MSFVEINGAIQRKIRSIRENGELIPVKFGFQTWNDYDAGKLIQGSRKCTLLIGGEPNHGKSTFANELVMQMIEKHNFRVALFTTESGDVEKVFAYFCGLYIGKPYSKVRPDGKVNKFAMSDAEAAEAEEYLMNKLFVFKQDRMHSDYQRLDNIYKQLAEVESLYGFKFDSLVIDPIYDVDDFQPKADEVLRVLNRINLEAEENNRFDIIVNHVAETAKVTDKNGNRKKLTALADEFYGGKNNNRKAMLQVLVHRPSPTVDAHGVWLEGFDGSNEVIFENQTDIIILKVKPEGIALWGKYPIFRDWKSRRYYEKLPDGTPMFADCVRFKDVRPNERINIATITATPAQAFGGIEKTDDGYEDFPF